MEDDAHREVYETDVPLVLLNPHQNALRARSLFSTNLVVTYLDRYVHHHPNLFKWTHQLG